MMSAKELLEKTGCELKKDKPEGCDKPKGGESCAFDGALIVLNPIRDAAHLIHGPIECAGHGYEGRGTRSSGSQIFRQGFTTDLSEMDIIMGGEDKLLRAVAYVHRRYRPAAVFVYQTCVPGLTGDDVERVCRQAQEQLSLPVIPVIAPGFMGYKNLGNRIAGEVLLNRVIATQEPPPEKTAGPTVNLIGEYNIAGDLWNLLPLFEEMGVGVLAKMTGDASFQEICWAHRARGNLLVCGRALINVAQGMERRWAIPYREVSFYGMDNTSVALLAAAQLMADPAVEERTRQLVTRQEAQTRQALTPYLPGLAGKKAVVYTGGVKSWSIISALKDLGIEVVACGAKKSSQYDLEKIVALIGQERVMKEVSPKALLAAIQEHGADVLVAGGRNQYLAYKENIPFIDVNQERHSAYAGYAGMVALARDLTAAINAPVHALIQRKMPWEIR